MAALLEHFVMVIWHFSTPEDIVFTLDNLISNYSLLWILTLRIGQSFRLRKGALQAVRVECRAAPVM